MANQIRVAIHGAAGRMGLRLVSLVQSDDDLVLAAALEHSSSHAIGHDAGEQAGIGAIGIPISKDLLVPVDVVIDFSSPEGAVHLAQMCAEKRIPLVEATTGLSDSQKKIIQDAARHTTIVMAPSMSLAVNVAMKLVSDAARALKDLPAGVDMEIIERHHRFKEDAPSGTALRFGQLVAAEMGQTVHQHGREGQTGPRPRNQIGYHALRTGDNVGEHTIVFGMLGETLEISVRGHTRDSYAYGALTAAKFAATHPAGLYSMADVLGL